jgi:cation transport ATPase
MRIATLYSAAGWFGRRSSALLLSMTAIALAAGGVAWLAGAVGVADGCWLVAAGIGLALALWSAADSLRRGRLGVDIIALLALAGAVAVRELLAAAVISVMLASGRALEAWAAARAR